MINHLPQKVNWNVSIMDPANSWKLIPSVIALGGHIRVGWEDNPYLPNGEIARTNAQLVETVVKIAEQMGRPIATPSMARKITGLNSQGN
jgi:3-keto-5-aminohexanoate cleavage enzyme